jgi:hypothetical protein
MDHQKEKISTQLSEIRDYHDLEIMIHEKEQLLELKEQQLKLRRDLVYARIEQKFGVSTNHFDGFKLVRGLLSSLLEAKPELKNSSFIPFISKALKIVPAVTKMFR